MQLQDLSTLDILEGFMSLSYVIITLIMAIKVLWKYKTTKDKVFITVGGALLFLSSGLWGLTFSFLSILLINQPLSRSTYLSLNTVFGSAAILCWMYSFSELCYPDLKKKILSFYLSICGVYEVFLISFLIVEPTIIGTVTGPLNQELTIYPIIFSIFLLLSTLISGILFVRESLKAEKKSIQIKGRFLLLAFLSFTFGEILDTILPKEAVVIIIVRLIIISSVFEYYLGFFLPKWLEIALIKEQVRMVQEIAK